MSLGAGNGAQLWPPKTSAIFHHPPVSDHHRNCSYVGTLLLFPLSGNSSQSGSQRFLSLSLSLLVHGKIVRTVEHFCWETAIATMSLPLIFDSCCHTRLKVFFSFCFNNFIWLFSKFLFFKQHLFSIQILVSVFLSNHLLPTITSMFSQLIPFWWNLLYQS